MGILLIQLSIREELDTNEKLLEKLRPVIAGKDIYKIIHEKDAPEGANFAGTFYEMILKLLGKNLAKNNSHN